MKKNIQKTVFLNAQGSKKKIKVEYSDWLIISQNIFKDFKKRYGLITRIKAIKNKLDIDKEMSKELIKRLEKKKISMEEAYHLAKVSAEKMNGMKNELPLLLVYLLGGFTMALCSMIFGWKYIPYAFSMEAWTSNYWWLIWASIFMVSSVFFIMGMRKRTVFERIMTSNGMLAQASAAYASAKAPGKGGSVFEAFQQLDMIKQNIKEQSKSSKGLFNWGGK